MLFRSQRQLIVAGEVLGRVGVGAGSAAVGSIASQVVGMGIGVQEKDLCLGLRGAQIRIVQCSFISAFTPSFPL